MKIDKKSIICLAAVFSLATAAVAFAHGGWEYGSHMRGNGGHMMGQAYGGGHMMGWNCDNGQYRRGYGAWGNLSDEDTAKLDALREKFNKDTRELIDRIDEKKFSLSDEMDKVNPDRDKIFGLQKEISSLQSEFDQKALAHQMEVRKLFPDSYHASGHEHGYCW